MPKDPNNQILETLADMNQAIGDRFDKVGGQIGELRNDMDRQFADVYQRFDRVDDQIKELRGDMDQQFGDVRGRLDRIEHLVLEDHARRLGVLERKTGIGNT